MQAASMSVRSLAAGDGAWVWVIPKARAFGEGEAAVECAGWWAGQFGCIEVCNVTLHNLYYRTMSLVQRQSSYSAAKRLSCSLNGSKNG